MAFTNDVSKEELQKLVDEGYRFYQIAEMYDVSPAWVTKTAKRYDIKARTSGEWRCSSQKITKEELETLYIKEKVSTKRIIEKLGIGMGTLHRLFKMYGIETRTKIEGKRLEKSQNVNANVSFFQNDTAEKFYVVGLIASDGFVRGNIISFTSKDYELAKFFADTIGFKNAIREETHKLSSKVTYSYKVQFSSAEIVAILLEYGVTERKSLSFFPTNVPNEFLADFLRGVFDGDGSVSFLKRRDTGALSSKFTIVTASEDFALFMHKAFSELGVPINKMICDKRGNKLYSVSAGNRKSIASITKWLYGNQFEKFGLSRKKEKMITITELALGS